MGHTKVFVGNLSFKTKEADLASEFSSVGRVVSANIITRGPRSLGYGFVELESEEDALRAVSLMNKKNIDSRDINVELAKPRDESKLSERRSPPNRGRGGFRGGFGGGYRGGYRGGFGGRGRRYRPRNQPDQEGYQNNNNNNNNEVRRPPLRRGRGGGPRVFQRQNLDSRTPSKTTLFVANLPFSLDDPALLDLFKDLKSTKAHVVRLRNGRSKGFGFVEFENEEDQKAALISAEKFEVEGRKLIVNIALTENRKPQERRGDEENNAPLNSTADRPTN